MDAESCWEGAVALYKLRRVMFSRTLLVILGCCSLMSCGGSDSPPDADGDSHADSSDCAPSDPGAWATLAFLSRDTDTDGFRVDATGSICAGAGLPAGYFAGATPASSVDCDDTDATRWATLTFAARDRDGDEHAVAESGSLCTGAALPAGYVAEAVGADVDCDDADPGIWIEVGYLGRDRDGDGHPVSEAGQLCLAAQVLPAGYAAQVPAALLDCADADSTRWRLVSVYQDQDGDGVGAGARQQQCMGVAPSAGFSLKGYDPNDDAGDPDAVLVSDIELPPTLRIVAEEADDEEIF